MTFPFFGPPSTAGSSNTLTLSSNSGDQATHGFAIPVLSKNLFSTRDNVVEDRANHDDDDLDYVR